MGSGSPGWRRPRPTRFPCRFTARPHSVRAIAERADCKSRLQVLFSIFFFSYWCNRKHMRDSRQLFLCRYI